MSFAVPTDAIASGLPFDDSSRCRACVVRRWVSAGEQGETEERFGRRVVGPVGLDCRGGAVGGFLEPRLSEELDESGRDFIRRGLDRQADAGTEPDDAPSVELLVASNRQQEEGRTVGESSECRA